MVSGMIGKKLGMTRIYDEGGNTIPVTLIELGPCTVAAVRTKEKDGYSAVQLGFEPMADKKVNKPMAGLFKKRGIGAFKVLREFRMENDPEHKVGDQITVDSVFKEKEIVKVVGTSKGAGFAGGVKKHGFFGAPMSHGASKVHRKPMSAGATDAARVFKGKRGPGHMGAARVTALNLTVVIVDAEKHLLAVRGSVPGKPNSIVIVRS